MNRDHLLFLRLHYILWLWFSATAFLLKYLPTVIMVAPVHPFFSHFSSLTSKIFDVTLSPAYSALECLTFQALMQYFSAAIGLLLPSQSRQLSVVFSNARLSWVISLHLARVCRGLYSFSVLFSAHTAHKLQRKNTDMVCQRTISELSTTSFGRFHYGMAHKALLS